MDCGGSKGSNKLKKTPPPALQLHSDMNPKNNAILVKKTSATNHTGRKLSGHDKMTNIYKLHYLMKMLGGDQFATPSTGYSADQNVLKSLEDEEENCNGDEEQLISNFKFCFNEETGKAIGFQPTKDPQLKSDE